jgi:uncharacterized protein (DUF362 family)
MLLDLSAYVKPRLSVVDAVVGMEGDGPARMLKNPLRDHFGCGS